MNIRQRLTALAISMVALLAVAFALTPAPASAQGVFDVCKQGGAGSSAVCTASGGNNLSGPNGIIIKVSNIFAFIGGVAAVIVIMVGGFVYITSAGDAGKASGGKNAVVYATVGLVVIVLGRAIIGFVISKF